MNLSDNPASADALKPLLAEIRQLRQEQAQTHRMVNRLRHARLSLVFALCLLFAGLGAAGSYGWLNRHTYPAGISITTKTLQSDAGEPVVAKVSPEAKASGDAIGYMRVDCPAEEEKEAYKILYPAYCTYIGGGIGQFTPVPYVVYFAAVIPGHIAGRVKASHVDERRQMERGTPPPPDTKNKPAS